jgi:hypothetical protein
MSNGIAPPGYEARLLGSAGSLEDLNFFQPLEEATPEGSLMLLELQFDDFPAIETLESLNQDLLNEGVPPWPGNTQIVLADSTKPVVYLAWVKGIAWMSVIVGMLVLLVLPTLLGALVWWLIPQEVKDLIMMAVMMLVIFLMFRMITPLLSPAEERKSVARSA